MWIEKIKPYMAHNQFIKPKSGVDFVVIKEAEQKLGVQFTPELISLLSEVNGDDVLLFSIKQIITYNIDSRRDYREVYDGIDNLLFIAGNGCGDYFAYKITDGAIISTDIVRWEHEDNSVVPIAGNLAELIEKYYTDQA